MARDEESNGSGNGSSGKSGRQDSSLSARRARLRSLAKQALPPDPYSKKQDNQADPAASLELEFLDDKIKEDESGSAGSAPAPDPNQTASTEPWLDNAVKSLTSPDPIPAPAVNPTPTYDSFDNSPAPDFSTLDPGTLAPPLPLPDGFSGFGGHPQSEPPPPPAPDFGMTPPTFDSFLQGSSEPPSSPFLNSGSGSNSEPPAPHHDSFIQQIANQATPNPFAYSTEPTFLQPAIDRSEHRSTLDIDYGDPEPEPVAREPESPTPPVEEEPDPAPVEEPPSAEATPVEVPELEPPVAKEQPPEPEPEEPVKEPPAAKSKRSRRKADPEAEAAEIEAEAEKVEEEPAKLEEEPPEPEEEPEPPKAKVKEVEEEREETKPQSDKKQSESKKNGDDEDLKPAAEPTAAAIHASTVSVEILTKSQAEALELLSSIDQALAVCALNLSSLQTTGGEQIEVLRNLKETLQNQTFFELGLNLNTLMESMSAALEPMKAVGELVPAIDQLVSAMVAREESEKETRLTPDKLVTALADQLGAGEIDPWTFKCAYMAVYPDEHPADLLHRLVDLLGTQRLSGELFRAAYDAVQAAEPPRSPGEGQVREVEVIKEVVKVVQDEEMVRQLEDLKRSNEDMRAMVEGVEDLKRANEDLRRIVENQDPDLAKRLEERERELVQRLEEREQELSKRIEERENEYAELLASKEQEIQETQEMLHSRFEEFNSRYEEMVETVNQRDEELKTKDDELSRKDSEINNLKVQLDELKEQYKDTVENLQKQLTSTQKMAQEASKQAVQSVQMPPQPQAAPALKPMGEDRKSGFFDQEPKAAGASTGGFAASSGQPLFQQQMDTFNSMSKPMAPMDSNSGVPSTFGAPPTPGAPPPPQPGGFGGGPPTGPIPDPPSNQAVPKPPSSGSAMGPLTGSGSYGSGVRAQVFEVIVRQALAGAPWREICAGPMSVNNISADEVEAEVKRREALLKK